MLKHVRRRYHRCISFALVILFFIATGIPCAFGQDTAYLDELLALAAQQRLHEDPYWRILMHYKKGFHGYTSLVDDPAFFLAPDGKTNPEAELNATLKAFFEEPPAGKQAAVCRFAARYEWLRDHLHIDPGRIAQADCASFEEFMQQMQPESVVLVFPMAHLNGPASMFGHTLLTIETANKSKLLAYAVTYSAFANETFGPFFAVKGLTGLYPGYFSIMPYYAKLQEYSDIDHRDIWEYPLNLTKPEIRRMMLHIRELDHIASDYYFFDENCSYALYFLLEAARPGVRLTDETHGWLIPLDSVRAIDRQGFIEGVAYRPSRTTKIKYLAAGLTDTEQDMAMGLAKGTVSEAVQADPSAPSAEKIRTVDLAVEYLQYLYTKGLMPQATYQERYIRTLKLRSQLGTFADDFTKQIPPPVQPDKGHRSNRLALSSGIKGDDAYVETRIRPVYHGLMDNDDGYVKGAQLIFTDLALRWYPEDHKGSLQSLDLIDIVSLAPRGKFFRPVSWKISTGLKRITGEDEKDHLVYQINPGGGMTLSTTYFGLVYAMMETGLNVSGALEQNYALGAGGSAGMLANPLPRWKVHLYGRDIYYGLGDSFNAFEAGLQQNYTITTNQSVGLDITRRKTRGFYETEAKLAWNLFF